MRIQTMNCRTFHRFADALVDAELDPGTQIEMEQHLATCAECQELVAFERAVKREIKQSVAAVRAPTALRSRIESALTHGAVASHGAPSRRPLFRVHVLPARYAIPATIASVAAAAIAGVLWMNQGDAAEAEQAATLPIFEDVVHVHSNSLPSDVTGSQPPAVTSWFRGKVDFPVRPAQLGAGSRLVGARLSHVRERNAAALFYDVGGRRVTVVMFAQPRPQATFRGLYVEHVGGRSVVHRRIGGYTVSAREDDGVTYAFTGDMDEETLVRLAATAHLQ